MNLTSQYENFYDWNIQRREAPIPVAQWIGEFTQWRKDYHSLVGNHPGYLIKLTRTNFFHWDPKCWVNTWCNENVERHPDNTPAFALVIVKNSIVYDSNDPLIDGRFHEVIRVLFDRESDAAFFKLSFLDKISPKISTMANSCNF